MAPESVLKLIFQLIALVFSVIVHEVAHGAVALRLGDQTAKLAGRLTLNPLKHLDPIGSFAVPILLFFLTAGGLVMGWAKPVPYNPLNLKNPKRGAGLIAGAGPLSNLLLALVFGIIVRFFSVLPENSLIANMSPLIGTVILINIVLAVFNLLPLPPLDGSGILFSLLPPGERRVQYFLYRYGFLILILFIWFGFPLLQPIIAGLYRVIAGDMPLF